MKQPQPCLPVVPSQSLLSWNQLVFCPHHSLAQPSLKSPGLPCHQSLWEVWASRSLTSHQHLTPLGTPFSGGLSDSTFSQLSFTSPAAPPHHQLLLFLLHELILQCVALISWDPQGLILGCLLLSVPDLVSSFQWLHLPLCVLISFHVS